MELVVRQRDGAEVARWSLTAGEYTFGASAGNDLRIDARGVSGRHARIFIADDAAFIEDIGSRFGTHQGGLPIDGRVQFSTYRPAEIGDLLFVVQRIGRRVKSGLPMATIHVSRRPTDSRSEAIPTKESSGEKSRENPAPAIRPLPQMTLAKLLLAAGAIALIGIVLGAIVAAATAIFIDRRFPASPQRSEAVGR